MTEVQRMLLRIASDVLALQSQALNGKVVTPEMEAKLSQAEKLIDEVEQGLLPDSDDVFDP